MNYKTCVSIAERTPYKIRQTLDVALKKSDYAEVRFDFLKAEQIPDALDLIKGDLGRVVCTLRPTAEGGKFSGDEVERTLVLRLIAEYDPFLLDVEFNTLKGDTSLRRYLKSADTKLLVSWHDFKGTPSSKDLEGRIRQMSRLSSNVKIVCTARSTDDAIRMLELYDKKIENIDSMISFAMGSFGRVSRILCLHLGSPFTYVSLGKAVAPGQFSVEEIKRIAGLRGICR